MVAVADHERERAPERATVPKSGEHLDGVPLQTLPLASPVALLAPVQVAVDRLLVEHQPGRSPSAIPMSAGPCDSPAVVSRRVTRQA